MMINWLLWSLILLGLYGMTKMLCGIRVPERGSVVIFQGAINYLNEYHDANPVDVVPV